MNFKTIKIDAAAHIMSLTFKRAAKLNRITPEFIEELGQVIGQLYVDPNIRCVIITGNGRAFCEGVDVDTLVEISTTLPPEALANRVQNWQGVFESLERLPQLTVAAINGNALGAGLELALACDFRIASTRAFFGMPQVIQGIVPDLGGITRLSRTVGPAWTKEIVFRGRNFNSMEALRVGLVNRVSEPGDLIGTAQKWASQFASLPQEAVRAAKGLINASFDLEPAESLRRVREEQLKLVQTEEFRMAVHAAREAETAET